MPARAELGFFWKFCSLLSRDEPSFRWGRGFQGSNRSLWRYSGAISIPWANLDVPEPLPQVPN